jgi:ubiquinone/menaquinone biosynthesis C-methylase UbiE
MKKELNINEILGEWKDPNILKKFKGNKEHKFLDRNRTLRINWKRLHEWAPEVLLSDSEKKIIDVACGNGATMEIFKIYGHKPFGIDFSPGFPNNDWLYRPMIESQGLHCKVHDASRLPYPFKDKQFDFAICYGAITFFKPIENWPLILDEFARISRDSFVIGVNTGQVYEAGKKYIENWKHPDFKIARKSGSVYKWVSNR